MSRRGVTLLTAGALVVLLGILAAVLPVPYVVLVPGPVTDTLGKVGSTQVISVSGAQTYPDSGHLYLTTVGVIPGSCDKNPTLEQALKAWFDKHEAVQPKQAICPPGQTSHAVAQQNADEMTQSQQDAITAALLYLHYKPTSLHVSVGSVSDGTPAAAVLHTGDQILAINGTNVTGLDQLHSLISAHPAGSTLALSVDRHGKHLDLQARTYTDSGRTVLGFQPDLQATFATPDVKIGLDPNSVGGPSAGLAFTLGIIDKLTPGSLSGGRVVAGTVALAAADAATALQFGTASSAVNGWLRLIGLCLVALGAVGGVGQSLVLRLPAGATAGVVVPLGAPFVAAYAAGVAGVV
ncbi:MAG TPA: PDZ domain-containing protein, partial [Mycobacteriales bacterium]|nr:PDZ domain-containing protein [Mycobacteriales bacterium]